MIKTVSQEARRDIEELVGAQVYLDLWVKVRPKWRHKSNELARLGFGEPD
jgi:GTP-binding protein Era